MPSASISLHATCSCRIPTTIRSYGRSTGVWPSSGEKSLIHSEDIFQHLDMSMAPPIPFGRCVLYIPLDVCIVLGSYLLHNLYCRCARAAAESTVQTSEGCS